MSLFVCKICKCVDDSNLMAKGDLSIKDEFPRMSKVEMEGWNDETKEWGSPNYLCSLCNMGKWHGEFPRVLANANELEIASYSKYNFITPRDHPDGCLTGSYGNYHVDERYKLFVMLFGEDVNSENNVLFKIYLEDRQNFDITCLEELDTFKARFVGHTADSIFEAIYNSQIYSGVYHSKSETYKRILNSSISTNPLDTDYEGDAMYAIPRTTGKSDYRWSWDNIYKNFLKEEDDETSRRKVQAGMFLGNTSAMLGMDLESMVDAYVNKISTKPKHWKELQSVSDKDKALRKAQLKREIKSIKKNMNTVSKTNCHKADDLFKLDTLEKEYKKLHR